MAESVEFTETERALIARRFDALDQARLDLAKTVQIILELRGVQGDVQIDEATRTVRMPGALPDAQNANERREPGQEQ